VGKPLAARRMGDIGQEKPEGHLQVAATKTNTIARVNEVLSAFAQRDYHGEVLTAVRRFPARAPEFADWPEWMRPELRAAYAGKGIARLYSHQAAAAEAVRAGKNVVIVTPTASGKTLCYNLPVIDAILENEDTRALYLFPTKALAQDQLAELYDLNQKLEEQR
jgi:DEAD/DEAH box helicase domain-containing protein